MQMEPPPMPTFTKSAPALGQEAEAVRVHDVAGADLDAVAVAARGSRSRVRFCHSEKPSEESMHEHVRPGLDQRGHALARSRGC